MGWHRYTIGQERRHLGQDGLLLTYRRCGARYHRHLLAALSLVSVAIAGSVVVRAAIPMSPVLLAFARPAVASDDGGIAVRTTLNGPIGVAVDGHGTLYIADSKDNKVRAVTLHTGTIVTVAGDGHKGSGGDGGPATRAQLYGPAGLAMDRRGILYIADAYNNRVRAVDLRTGTISTAAGADKATERGERSVFAHGQLDLPTAIATDGRGILYIADSGNNRVRAFNSSARTIVTVAGDGLRGGGGDGGPATRAYLYSPDGVVVDGRGTLYIADTGNDTVRAVDPRTGTIMTIAGGGRRDTRGASSPAVRADLGGPAGLAVDGHNRLYIADFSNNRVRAVDLRTGTITTIAGRP